MRNDKLVKNTVEEVLKYHAFEANDEITWDSIRAQMIARLGILVVENKISDFVVVCNESNNIPNTDRAACLVAIQFDTDGQFYDRSAAITSVETNHTNTSHDAYDRAMSIV